MDLVKNPVILGSSSIYRQQILREMGYNYTILKPDIDEYSITIKSSSDRAHSNPADLSEAISRYKLDALIPLLTTEQKNNATLVITSDQVAFYKGEIREKPKNEQQVHEWIPQYAIEPVRTVTSIVVYNSLTGKIVQGNSFASQLFSPMTSEEIDLVIQQGEIMRCCGGFIVGIKETEPFLREREGSLDSLTGFPKDLVQTLLIDASS